ncbi:hypothetical protein [Nocardiopsis alba]|uniref:hypothetical protein n=2 Tax=Nocardiopsis alba TaxID=53437 RepID=UPI0033E974F6
MRKGQMNINANSMTSIDSKMYLPITELSRIMTLTLPQIGMDRMTVPRVEETLACSALTAHF